MPENVRGVCMCGITGIFRFDSKPVEKSLLQTMNDQIIHRGPDAEGLFTHEHVGLAMRRLKVIDLSTGNQPILTRDKKLCIIFNGEIYNYRELRSVLERQGHQFSTNSDTEVILHLYQEKREACVDSLVGMFAFAIYDSSDDSLFIARDRLGVKPLFYHQSSAGFVFGSEIKPILKAPWVEKRLNYQAIGHFLSLNYLSQPWTPFKGVYQLAPGHWMKISKLGVKIQEYWDVPLGETIDLGEDEACRKIMELFHRSMERRLIADVPIGTYLSGGLDSSALVWLMKEHKHETVKTFSVGFDHPDYDETPYAREVAKYFGTDHYEVHCKADDVLQLLPKVVWHADNLLGDQAALPLYMVSKLAKKHVTVCLSGDGGDEVFIGYPTFHADRYHRYYQQIPEFIRRGIIQPAVEMIPASANKVAFEYKIKKFVEVGIFSPEKAHYWWRTIYRDEEKMHLLTPQALSEVQSMDSYPLYGEYFTKAFKADEVNRALYADMKVWLVGNNLYKVDTMSMAHGLEARVPFLDHELVEFMAKLPPSLKFKNNVLKYLLKKILVGKIPKSIRVRKKAGFHSPVAFWFREFLYEDLKRILLEREGEFSKIIKLETVQNLLGEHASGRQNNAFKIWGLLVLKQWIRHFENGFQRV